MKNLFKKPLNYILTGSFSIVFAACYGAPVNLENPKLIKATDNTNQPIEGLKVIITRDKTTIDEGFTGKDGSIEFYIEQEINSIYKASIEDIDGNDNGGEFTNAEINITDTSFVEVVLEKKN